ncbi:hypothetical protein ACVW1A_005710 [Bradyrhizobium sp. LB1.3]
MIGICGEHVGTNDRAQCSQIGEIGLGSEPDLQLQRAMAALERGFGCLRGAAGIDAAGIDLDPARLPAEKPPQWQALPTRGEIPQSEIDARNRLRERAGLAALKRKHLGALGQDLECQRGTIELAPYEAGREHLVDEPCAMLRPRCGEVWTRLRPTPRRRLRRQHERRRRGG